MPLRDFIWGAGCNMKKWDNSNHGLGATWMIEKAVCFLGGNDCNIVEYGSGNGRLLNFVMDIGCENTIGYDINPCKENRLRAENIKHKNIEDYQLSGDLCLAFHFFNYDNQGYLEEALKTFKLVIGSVDDLDTICSIKHRKFKGYKNEHYFIASRDENLLNTLTSSTVIDFLVVGRFAGITPSVRRVMKSLRGSGYRVFSTIPRTNGNETVKWFHKNNFNVDTVLMNNCADWDPQMRTYCGKAGIPIITFEDGFIPHYSGLHFDRKGFCWESSFPYENVSKYPDNEEQFNMSSYDMKRPEVSVDKPFVFVPLQMLGDSVILHGSDVKSWDAFVSKVREDVPEEYDLVVKNHPREKSKFESRDPSIHVIDDGLGWAIDESEFVVGVNSGVLYESAFIFNKPVYYYGKSWYDRHPEVCRPARGILEKYDIDTNIRTYRRRFWQFMKSKQLDYSDGFDDKRLIKLIQKEKLSYYA
jgi:hypothetical protein